ncbi:hypothetical protein BOTBODRAFT_132833 [Botryobasidium botryosum FD-172 SS1]|uniref:F-box domain-containing protein n=1 Tax=Botryobasidium botryosum (strain FD-172 SS1) TaxID=930990 RepID=A0A067MQ09_BOTB1|nr:hypothetical protein BOTBODRAFT_132833 [Botryobasidium botryosum FD-172 SS1]
MLATAEHYSSIARVCRAWERSIEFHPYWIRACALLDPLWTSSVFTNLQQNSRGLGARTAVPQQFSLSLFNFILNTSCLPCRINNPTTSVGVNNTHRVERSHYNDLIRCCKAHRARDFCGVCLKDAVVRSFIQPPPDEDGRYGLLQCVAEVDAEARYAAGIELNEDTQSFPRIVATCTLCRHYAVTNHLRLFAPHIRYQEDTHIRRIIDEFVDFGEGGVRGVMEGIEECIWLKNWTRYEQLWKEAVASQRLIAYSNGYDVDGDACLDVSRSPSPSSRSSPSSVLSHASSSSIRTIALNDWARNRVLDGCWIAPLDMYQWHLQMQGAIQRGLSAGYDFGIMAAHHPLDLIRDGESRGRLGRNSSFHPHPQQIRCAVPPTRVLHSAQRAFEQNMRTMLLPPMANFVRRLVIECEAGNMDVCSYASSISFETLIGRHALGGPECWMDGYNWNFSSSVPPRGREDSPSNETDTTDADTDMGHKTESTITSDPHSDTSTRPSPSSTLHTSPSPPPPLSLPGDKEISPSAPPTVPSQETDSVTTSKSYTRDASVPSPPAPAMRVIHPIPHLPINPHGVGSFARSIVENLWREATAGLYICQCKICLRTARAANGVIAKEQDWVQLHEQELALSTRDTYSDTGTDGQLLDEDDQDMVDEDDEEDDEAEEEEGEYGTDYDLAAQGFADHPQFRLMPLKMPSSVSSDVDMGVATATNSPMPYDLDIKNTDGGGGGGDVSAKVGAKTSPSRTSSVGSTDSQASGRRSRDPEELDGREAGRKRVKT